MDTSDIKGFLGSRNSIIFILAFVVVSLVVALFNNIYISSKTWELRTQEIAAKINTSNSGFADTAKRVMDSDENILFIKLLDANGVLQESLGADNGEPAKNVVVNTADSNQVILGLKDNGSTTFNIPSLFWSVLIGAIVSCLFLVIFSVFTPSKPQLLDKLISAMKRVARGDMTARVDTAGVVNEDVIYLRTFEAFNQMMDNFGAEAEEQWDEPLFQPSVIDTPELEEHTSTRHVTVMVAKIADFHDLSTELEPGEFNAFLSEFRKSASSIISDYGGVIEALLKDEIVAFFNAPDELDKPELRAVCSAVEVLQLLASMTKERKLEGKSAISGKIGIDWRSLQFFENSSIPQGIRDVTSNARSISEIAPLWRVIVKTDFYEPLNEYIEVRELVLGDDSYYSVVGVEEGIV